MRMLLTFWNICIDSFFIKLVFCPKNSNGSFLYYLKHKKGYLKAVGKLHFKKSLMFFLNLSVFLKVKVLNSQTSHQRNSHSILENVLFSLDHFYSLFVFSYHFVVHYKMIFNPRRSRKSRGQILQI